jgi:hypothetical protein
MNHASQIGMDDNLKRYFAASPPAASSRSWRSGCSEQRHARVATVRLKAWAKSPSGGDLDNQQQVQGEKFREQQGLASH